MENRAHALAAGAFVLLLGLALIAAVVWIRGSHTDRVEHLVVAHGSVPGLAAKADVRLRGVDVGSVESIAFDPRDPRRILIRIAVDRSAPLTRGTTAHLSYQGVTGLSYVALDDKGTDPRPLAAATTAEPTIELQPSLLEDLASAGPQVLANVNAVTDKLNALLDAPNRQRLERTLDSAGQAATELGARAAELKPAITALAPLLRDADAATRRADAALARLDGVADASARLVDDLRGRLVALDRLADAAGRVESAARSLEVGLVGVDAPPRPPLLDQLGRAAQGVERVVGQWGDEPRSLIFGRNPGPPGPGEAGYDGGAAR